MPTLKRKIAMAAATLNANAHGSTLAGLGASKANGKKRIGTVSWNIEWMANQIARLRTTPTTAAVMADRTAFRVVADQRFDIGPAEKNPEEAGYERDPGGKRRPAIPPVLAKARPDYDMPP